MYQFGSNKQALGRTRELYGSTKGNLHAFWSG